MKTIEHVRELPYGDYRAYAVQDEEHAREVAEGKTAYLFRQTENALYIFLPLVGQAESETME
jgi:hypothetical protein